MNYGEDTAYWYLRLNGFFLLQNFVSHGYSETPTAQIDLLGVRPAFVHEEVGGQVVESDQSLITQLAASNRSVGVICEVKTGRSINPDELFQPRRLAGAVRRLGLLSRLQIDELMEDLSASQHATIGKVTVAKLLISKERKASDRYHNLLLDDAEAFVQDRARRFAEIKQRDRMLFPWGLFQYAINRERRGP